MALGAIEELFNELNESKVRYCHWKSNYNLARSMKGLTDLDLLVDPGHGDRFSLILRQHSVKPVVSSPDQQYPAIHHHLGFDKKTGSMFHLHVHYQLILGEQLVKNYRLPLEKIFMDSTKVEQGIKVPSPELELIILSIRALLKYRDRDVVKDIFSIRTPGLPPAIIKEFEYLLDETNAENVLRKLKEDVDFISPDVVMTLLSTITTSPRSGRVLYRLRRTVRRDLINYKLKSRWWVTRTYFGALLRKSLPFIGPYSYKKIPVTGGKVIAVIGADGAGKSTVTRELCQWMSYQIQSHFYYMGSQEASQISRLVYVFHRIARKAHRTWSEFVGEERISSKALSWLKYLTRNFHHISISQDRYRRFVAGRRRAANGEIVFCDRYPLAAIHQVMEQRPMDGPQIAAEAGEHMDRVTKSLSEYEKKVYTKILPPDYIFVLHVSPEVAKQRKPSDSGEMIEIKSRALKQMDTRGLNVIEIDADQSYDHVLLQIKKSIWQLL